MEADIRQIEELTTSNSPEQALLSLAKAFPGKVVFSTSLGYEDQLITHYIFQNQIPIEVFTLDTGRLFNETYSVLQSTLTKYKQPIHIFHPQKNVVEKLVNEKGLHSFYESVENRRECCYIRKMEPLKRALIGKYIWVTGIRSDQSANRKLIPQVEWDEINQIFKFHPLLHWTLGEVKNYVHEHNIPYNPLHNKGFVSIGCEPCTRATRPEEDIRAGRWWWEDNSKRECGLHLHQ